MVGMAVAGCVGMGGGKRGGEAVDFGADVKPILEHRCLECHGRKAPAGGLSFQDREVVMATMRGGMKLIDAGDADESLLYVAVTRGGKHPGMMPGDGWKLTDAQLATLGRWIDQGAEWPEGKGGELKVGEWVVEMDDYP